MWPRGQEQENRVGKLETSLKEGRSSLGKMSKMDGSDQTRRKGSENGALEG